MKNNPKILKFADQQTFLNGVIDFSPGVHLILPENQPILEIQIVILNEFHKLCAFWVHTKNKSKILSQILPLSPTLCLTPKLLAYHSYQIIPVFLTNFNNFVKNTQLLTQICKLEHISR